MKRAISRRGFLAASATAIAAGCSGLPTATRTAPPPEKVVRITTRRFEFVPSRITLRKGESVTLEFHALDIAMGFKLPDFGLRTDVIPGKATRLSLTPTKTGTFEFYCDVFCGSGHEDMDGTLVVVA